MPLLSALFSLIGRKLSSILRAIFGWSTKSLFGSLPKNKETALTIAVVLSLAWPVLVVGIAFPAVASWTLAFLPLERWVSRNVLRAIWLVLAVLAPLLVGAITRWVSPHDTKPRSKLKTILAGYPITIGYAISFLITLFVVPALKVGTVMKRWTDQHLFVEAEPARYHDVLRAVREACEGNGVKVVETEVPAVMRLATRVLSWFARGGIDPLVPSEPKMLRGEGLEIFLYPADLLLRGEKRNVAHVRTLLVRGLLHAPALLTSDEDAQPIEREIHRLWEVIERHHRLGHEPVPGRFFKNRIAELAKQLERADIPFEDWVLLYTNLNRLERALWRSPSVVDDPRLGALRLART
jgi:hypothetical protein